MTLRHIAAIYFAGHCEAAKKRVRKLAVHGYLFQRPRKLGEPSIYGLSHTAFKVLQREGRLEGDLYRGWARHAERFQVSRLTLEHELAVLDCTAAIVTAIQERPGLSRTEHSTWPQRLQFQAFDPENRRQTTVKPDGYVSFRDAASKTMRFFVEVDRSTETLHSLVNRIIRYRSFYRQGGMARRLGYDPTLYREHPFRLLVVCKSEERRRLLAQRLGSLRPPIRGFVYITTLGELQANSGAVIGV